MNRTLDPRERSAVLFLGTAHALTHAMMLAFPAILIPLMDEFGLGLFGVGLLGNLGYLLFGVGALPAGYLSDRWGPRKVLLVFCAGTSFACLLIYLSSGIVLLAIGLLLSGAAASLYHPSGLSYLTQAVRQRGKALGYHGMGGNVGLAVAPVLAAWITVAVGWRFVYLLFAILFAALGVVDWRSRFWVETRRDVAGDATDAEEEGSTERVPLFVLYVILIIAGFIYRGALTYLPAYLSQRAGEGSDWTLTIGQAGTMTTVALLLGIFAQWLGGNLSQRYRLESLGLVLIVLALPFLVWMSRTGGTTLLVMTGAFVFFYFCWQPVGNGLVAAYTRRSARSLGFGISFSLSFGAGSFASSIAGYIGEFFGLDRVFLFLAGLLSLILVLSVVLLVLARGRGARAPDGAGGV